MKALWNITIEDYLAVVKICQNKGMAPGSSMEKEFLAYMKEKGQKPMGHTGLNRDELLKEYASHGNSVLDIETDKNGKSQYKVIKKPPALDK